MLQLSQNSVDIWVSFSDRVAFKGFERYIDLLSDEECERYKAFRFEWQRREFFNSRIGIRWVLSQYIECEVFEWTFLKNKFGKPYVNAAIPIKFNISHSGGLVVFAITLGREVGIDTENFIEQDINLNIAKRFFAREEADRLKRQSFSVRQRSFYEYWTLKEAYAKAKGEGMNIPLDMTCFLIDEKGGENWVVFKDKTTENFEFFQWYPSTSHVLSLALWGEAVSKTSITVRECMPLCTKKVLHSNLNNTPLLREFSVKNAL